MYAAALKKLDSTMYILVVGTNTGNRNNSKIGCFGALGSEYNRISTSFIILEEASRGKLNPAVIGLGFHKNGVWGNSRPDQQRSKCSMFNIQTLTDI